MPLRRVLIVDDEADVRAVICGCLEDIAGWQVVSAHSGQDGLNKIGAEKPNAILLDVMMPEMDGLEFLSHLRANPNTSTIPVVLLTAKTAAIDSSMITKLGVVGAIAKPFNPMLLSQQIAKILGWQDEKSVIEK